MSETKSITGAYSRIGAHEELCAERYRAIHETLADMKSDAKTQNRLIVGVLLALVGWMGVQLWTGQTQAHAPVAAVSR